MDGMGMKWNVEAIAGFVMIAKPQLNVRQTMITKCGVMNRGTNPGAYMDVMKEILPIVFKLVEKKKCAINVSKIDNEVVVNIIERFRTRCFKSADSQRLITNLKYYLQA